MFKNHFKLAWRNLIKDRQFTALNLLGLSAGLACTLLIYLWVNDERRVDKFNENDSRLYQVFKNSPNADGTVYTGTYTQGLLAQTMAKELPEVEYAVAVRPQSVGVLSVGETNIRAKSAFVDRDFFHVFSYPLVEGNKENPLADKYGILLSDKLALKLFNTTRGLVGKPVSWNRGEFTGNYTIAGVFTSPPDNATDQYDLLFTYELFATKEGEDLAFWGSNGENTYLVLKTGTNIAQFNKKIKDFTRSKIKSLYPNNDMLKWEGQVFVQRYSDKYLYNHFENGVQQGGRIEYVKLFSIIAIFILFIACINFMNLSTAKASRRIKEVGIKKVAGANRRSLILQYMGESMLMALASLVLAIVFVILLLPAFREITGKNLALQLRGSMILPVVIITIITGLVAGSYPAFYLSGFKPAQVLKGKQISTAGESWLRKGLVIFQFAISVILIVSVLVVYRQMKLVQSTHLGYNKENIVRFSNEGRLKQNLPALLVELRKLPGVANASDADGDLVGNAGHSGSGISWPGKDPRAGIEYYGVGVDNDFIETMGIRMLEGRSFSGPAGADSAKVIFNETAIKAMGITNPVGKKVSLWGKEKEIIGVARDYHYESLYKRIGPAFLTWSPNNENVLVKLKAGKEKETIHQLEQLYKTYNQGIAFEYRFLDEDYQALYTSEQRVAVLSRYFAAIAILISCLGLFGLAAFTAQKRQKEIGIRKVVGASVGHVTLMLSTDYIKLVLAALLIAIPVSWWACNQWLQHFAIRIHPGGGIFVATGVCVLLITIITIGFQTIRAALANPVKSLRTE